MGPGIGPGWTRVSTALAEFVPTSEIEGIWLFTPVRRDGREWGVAVVTRQAAGERRRIYTASYALILRGKERGHAKVTVQEVGEGPATVLHDVIRGVQHRSGDAEPPSEISPAVWYEEEDPALDSTDFHASVSQAQDSSTGVGENAVHTQPDETGGLE